MAELAVTVWNEFRHEKKDETVKAVYPNGMHEVIAEFLRAEPGLRVRTATLDEPEHGLSDAVLQSTDVLLWWGHLAHDQVDDAIVEAVRQRVLDGMGLIVLHSGHLSKIFRVLMGTTCKLKWREMGEKERLWVIDPSHPIAAGLPEHFELPASEMYGERFDIPAPDDLVFVSWYAGGDVFRSGCCFRRGRGKIFYFSPGHETYPIYRDRWIQRVIVNGVHWAAPTPGPASKFGQSLPPLEGV